MRDLPRVSLCPRWVKGRGAQARSADVKSGHGFRDDERQADGMKYFSETKGMGPSGPELICVQRRFLASAEADPVQEFLAATLPLRARARIMRARRDGAV